MKDLYHDLLAAYSIYPASLGAAAKTGDAIVDLQGYEGALIVCGSGALTVDMPFQLMHGDAANLSDAAAVPDTDLLGTEPTLLQATDNEIKTFGYKGGKRYLRVDTTTGTGVAFAAIIKGAPRHAPVI
ncbi:MAG: hypothetical protein MUP28_02265 [Candidatus Aminicenantes bacterium]|nr:hypothetical protein [Candidatus Aminicenantes bacterium]